MGWPTDVLNALVRGQAEFLSVNSTREAAREGYTILFEAVDELGEAVRLRYGVSRDAAIRHEAVQVAAMALRFLIDVCDKELK